MEKLQTRARKSADELQDLFRQDAAELAATDDAKVTPLRRARG